MPSSKRSALISPFSTAGSRIASTIAVNVRTKPSTRSGRLAST